MFRCTRDGLIQILACMDMEKPETFEWYKENMPAMVGAVYSDPPWSPGNATYWRTMAGESPCESYERFCAAWARVAGLAIKRGAVDVLVEQSANPKHQKYLLDAMKDVGLPLLSTWGVQYSGGPNSLLHFGWNVLSTNPQGMKGEPMTIRACCGLRNPPGSWVVEPCIGFGMASRIAHYFEWSLIGTELNQKRLNRALSWLVRQGYSVEES